MRWLIPLSILVTLFLGFPAHAEERAHVLFMLDADVDADGHPERLLVLSQESSDPSHRGPKEFRVLKRKGDLFETVFSESYKSAAFSNEVAELQWKIPTTAVGLKVSPLPPGVKYPSFMVIFTPNSDDAVFYQFDGKNFHRLGSEY